MSFIIDKQADKRLLKIDILIYMTPFNIVISRHIYFRKVQEIGKDGSTGM